MLDCQAVFEAIGKQGIRFFAGVPDSLLKDLCAYISDHTSNEEHVIAANEGNAIALAIGHYLGTAQPALVYMQNSGIGNAVNPLLSLADPDVYSIPVLLVIGWRGEPGRKDEPQHVKQGRTMTDLLDAMEIPWFQLPSDAASAVQTIEAAGKEMRANMGPVAIVVSAGTFDRYSLSRQAVTDYPMNREDAIKRILDQLDESDIVISDDRQSIPRSLRISAGRWVARHLTFSRVGGMGHTASIAMGVGMAQD